MFFKFSLHEAAGVSARRQPVTVKTTRWSLTMSFNETRAVRLSAAAFGLALTLALAPAAVGRMGAQQQQTSANRTFNTRPVPVGAKIKFRGVVVKRDADTFIVRDASRVDTQVLLTDDTSIK